MMPERFPDISEVDVTNGEDVKGFGRLLISLLHENGIIQMNAVPSLRQKKLIAIAGTWLDMVRDNVGLLGIEYRTLLMDRYDMLYRYVYRIIPDISFINQNRFEVVESLIRGNKKIDPAETVWMITYVMGRNKIFDSCGRAKKLHDLLLKNWVDDFESSGNFFDISQNEAVRRALTFIREDIRPFTENPETIRRAAAARISLLFNDFLRKDSKTLEAMLVYLTFAQGKYVDSEVAKVQSIEILRLLSVMPQVNKFDRLAYANDLKREIEN